MGSAKTILNAEENVIEVLLGLSLGSRMTHLYPGFVGSQAVNEANVEL